MARPEEKALGGKYEILQKIREGGMGAIYKVQHRLLDEIRIIKVLKSEFAMDESLRQRFQNEARIAIQLRHPNIAQLYDFSVSAEGKSSFIVMEFIDGVTLQELIRESGAPTLELAVEIASQGLHAISYLHGKGFIHRDIAADNLMLSRDFRGNPLVKLIDLGIAKGQDETLNLTATGMFMGKVRYSPPELFKSKEGASALDERSDLYSFGVLLYELLTGKNPFPGESFSEIVAGHLFKPPTPFDESDPDGQVPEGLRALCLRALEKDSSKRVETAEDFVRELGKFAGDGESHVDELKHAIEATTQLATLKRKSSAGDSTQRSLDRQFGADERSGGAAELAVDRDDAVQHAASAIRETTRSGTVEDADRALDLAETLYGEHTEFDGLREQLKGEDQPAAVPVAPAGGRRAAWLARALSPLGLLLALGLALVVAGLVWLGGVSKTSSTSATGEDAGTPLTVESAPRWESESEEPTDPFADVEIPSAEESEPTGAPAVSTREPSSPVRSEPAASAPVPAPSPGAGQTEPVASPDPQVRRGELFGPDPGVMPPSLVSMPDPVYPRRFDRPDRVIEVMVDVLVSEDGHVITAKASDRGSAKRRFRELAVETAKGAVFRPAEKYGVQGKMWTTIRVRLPPG